MVEIWAGTQSQTTATEAPAKILGIPKDSASGSFAVNRAATIRCQPRVRPKGPALQIRRWLPDRSIILVADSAFAAIEFLAAVRKHGYLPIAAALRAFC